MANDGWTDVPEASAPASDGWTDVPDTDWGDTAPAEGGLPRPDTNINVKDKRALAKYNLEAMKANPDFQLLSPSEQKRLLKSAEFNTKSEFGKNISRTYETFAQPARVAGETVQMAYGLGKKALAGYAGAATGAVTGDLNKAAEVAETIKNRGNFELPTDPSIIAQGINTGVEWQNKEADRTGTEWTKPLLEASMDILGVAGLAQTPGLSKYSKTPISQIPGDVARATGDFVKHPVESISTGAQSVVDSFKTTPEKAKTKMRSSFNELIPPTKKQAPNSASRVKYFDNAELAVDEMLNQEKSGRVAPHEGKPNVVTELDRISQAKNNLFAEYDALTKETTGKGIEASPDPVISVLEADAMRPGATEIRGYRDAVVKEIEQMKAEGNLTAEAIQDKIKVLNDMVKSKQWMSESVSNARIAQLKLAAYRQMIDDIVSGATGEHYAPLKKRYGALSEYENGMAGVVNKFDKSQGAGALSSLDLMAIGEGTIGLMKLNPALIKSMVVTEGMAMARRWNNHPNTKLSRIYKHANKYHGARTMGGMEPRVAPETGAVPVNPETGNWGAGAVDPLKNQPQDLTTNRMLPQVRPVTERGFQRAGIDYPIEGEVLPPVKPASPEPLTVEGELVGNKQIPHITDPRLSTDHTWNKWMEAEEAGNAGEANFWRGKFEEAVRYDQSIRPPK